MEKSMLYAHSDGSTAYETFLAIISCCLHALTSISILSKFNINSTILIFLVNFGLFIIPSILSFTLLSEYNHFIALLQFISIYLVNRNNMKNINKIHTGRTDFITNFRSITNCLSVIAILAVDFNIFPRKYAKTETYGYSLMDTGVGLFVFANGIVAPEARNRKDSVKKSIIGSIPLMVLGIARCLFVKQTNYNVPVSEYGVHWNFFITLIVIKIFSSFITNVVNIRYICIYSIILLLTHELLLNCGLANFALGNIKRDTLIKANKEGIVSSPGYVSLYLFSVYFGHILNSEYKIKTILITLATFIQGACASLLMFVIFKSCFGISRRLANSAYCFWILFIAIFFLGFLYIIQEYICSFNYSSLINEAVNYNGLIFFLIGNLLTGLINLSIDTSNEGDFSSLLIITMYMFLNCTLVCILYQNKKKLKL